MRPLPVDLYATRLSDNRMPAPFHAPDNDALALLVGLDHPAEQTEQRAGNRASRDRQIVFIRPHDPAEHATRNGSTDCLTTELPLTARKVPAVMQIERMDQVWRAIEYGLVVGTHVGAGRKRKNGCEYEDAKQCL